MIKIEPVSIEKWDELLAGTLRFGRLLGPVSKAVLALEPGTVIRIHHDCKHARGCSTSQTASVRGRRAFGYGEVFVRHEVDGALLVMRKPKEDQDGTGNQTKG